MGFMEKVFGDLNAKEVKKIEKIVDRVEALDETMQAKSDEELRAMTPAFKERLAAGLKVATVAPVVTEEKAVLPFVRPTTQSITPYSRVLR